VALVTLTATFPGLNSVHTYAHVPDGVAGSVGAQVGSATWKSGSATLVLLQGDYDVRIVHGPATYIADSVECGPCAVDVPLATLDVSFPGLSSTHVYAHVADGAPGSYGQQVVSSTWNSDGSSLTLMQALYDLRVVNGPMVTILDDVDCRAATCSAAVPLATLTIDFPGLTSAHMYAHVADGLVGTYGQQVLSSTWKSDTTSMILMRGTYDLRAVHGPSSLVLDDLDCRGGSCHVSVPLTTLTVTFPGLTNAHVYAHLADAVTGSYGQQVASSTWRSDSTSLVLLQGAYDLRVVHGPATTVLDGLDCQASTCAVEVPLARLTAEFPGRSSVHTYVHMPDGAPASAAGQQVSGSTWKAMSTEFTILRGAYDVRFVQSDTTSVVDDVDCTGPACSVDIAAATTAMGTPTSTATAVPATETPTPTPTNPPAALAAANAVVITFLTAICPTNSLLAIAVTGGSDPKSSDNGTSESVPGDINAYGCNEVSAPYRLYLLAGSTSSGTYTDPALTSAATINANDAAWDGTATTLSAGQSFYAWPEHAATRRFSVAEFPHNGSSWVGLPYLDLQCSTDGVNNDNGDGAGWNDVALAARQQVFCIFYFVDDTPEPTPTPSDTPAPVDADTPTPSAVPEGDGMVGKILHPDYKVDEATGIVTWIIWPIERGQKLYVWDDQAETCEAFGGAKCGGIGEGGGPGEFNPGLGNDQHLIVTQSLDAAGGQCEVTNSVSWAPKRNADDAERSSTTATYTCSGANALGWPLLAVGFAVAALAAWVVKQRATWPGR
jgi:hypothetical protein